MMLSVIASPIGSTEELSLQAAIALSSAQIILCEDTRTFVPFYKSTLSTHNLKPVTDQKIQSFYKDIEFNQLPKIIKLLESNVSIALISEAGTPLVSDPGRFLIETCQKKAIPYTSIPGSSAVLNAGVLSACYFENFLFVGFLPKKESHIIKQFELYLELSKKLKRLEVCFFESPHRITNTLKILSKVTPALKVYICREMNKKFEEVLIGYPSDLQNHEFKGEITVVLKFYD